MSGHGKTIGVIQKEIAVSEIFEILKAMQDADFLYLGEGDKEKSNGNDLKSTSISALTLMVAQECNMNCRYCYGEGGEYNNRGKMNSQIAKAAIDYLVKEAKEKELHIAFLGGEPLLNFNLIKEVVEYCILIEKTTDKRFAYTITTNGTLINNEIEQYLLEHKIVCQISMDGVKEKHDKNRVFANGAGSYDVILEKTKKMREKNLVTARATVSANNCDYIEIFNHLNELGFRAIPIAIAENMVSDEEFENVLELYKKYVSYFEHMVMQKEYAKARKMTDLVNALEKIEYGAKRSMGCGAGRFMNAVNIDGTLYPCHRFVGNDKVALGNIETGGDNTSFLEMIDISKREQCNNCWAQNLCLGGCPYENYNEAESVSKATDRTCRLQKMLYGELLKIYVNLNEDDKKNIFNK